MGVPLGQFKYADGPSKHLYTSRTLELRSKSSTTGSGAGMECGAWVGVDASVAAVPASLPACRRGGFSHLCTSRGVFRRGEKTILQADEGKAVENSNMYVHTETKTQAGLFYRIHTQRHSSLPTTIVYPQSIGASNIQSELNGNIVSESLGLPKFAQIR